MNQQETHPSSSIDTLTQKLSDTPENWDIRKELARQLFDNAQYKEAAELVWAAPEIPSIDLEIAFAARVLSRNTPRRAIRLLQHVLKQSLGKPAKLLAIANALMHYGMVLQAARFYGAATACEGNFENPDLEYFMLWLDDAQHLWGAWDKDKQQIEELPWVKRDKVKSSDYNKMMSGLTTPIKVPGLKKSDSEDIVNDFYRQDPVKGAKITAPPAVTVPLDQLNPDHIIHDEVRGAITTSSKPQKEEPSPQTPVSNQTTPSLPKPPKLQTPGTPPQITPPTPQPTIQGPPIIPASQVKVGISPQEMTSDGTTKQAPLPSLPPTPTHTPLTTPPEDNQPKKPKFKF